MTPCRVLISCEPCDFVVGDPRVQPHHSKFSAAVQSAQMVGKAYCCILLQPILKQCRLTMSNATCVQSIRRLDGSIATNLCESASCVGTAVGQPRSFQCNMCTEGCQAQPAAMHQNQVLRVAFAGRNETKVSNDYSTSLQKVVASITTPQRMTLGRPMFLKP